MNGKEELKEIARNSRWAWDELVVDAKMQEANRLCSDKSVLPMYNYLLSVHGDMLGVLGALRYIVQVQKRRLKSLTLHK